MVYIFNCRCGTSLLIFFKDQLPSSAVNQPAAGDDRMKRLGHACLSATCRLRERPVFQPHICQQLVYSFLWKLPYVKYNSIILIYMHNELTALIRFSCQIFEIVLIFISVSEADILGPID